MPHFTMPIGPEGPLLNAVVAVSEPKKQALEAAGLPVPPQVVIRALVDTGASCCLLDPSVVTSLGLTPTGVAQVKTPTTGNATVSSPQYDIMLLIPGSTLQHPPAIFPALPVVTAELLVPQGFHALIGRDLLADCVLVYNGATRLFTLGY